MDSARHTRSPAGASCTLVPQAKVAAHQPQQSSSSRLPLSSGLLTQMLVTACVVADQDQQPSPSDARGSRRNESTPTRAAESEFPPEPTITIGSSCRSVQTAPDGAATPTRLVAQQPSLTKPLHPATIQGPASIDAPPHFSFSHCDSFACAQVLRVRNCAPPEPSEVSPHPAALAAASLHLPGRP